MIVFSLCEQNVVIASEARQSMGRQVAARLAMTVG